MGCEAAPILNPSFKSDTPHALVLLLLCSRSQDKPAPTAFGQNQSGRRRLPYATAQRGALDDGGLHIHQSELPSNNRK
jgi:hypothetical protein